MAKKLHVAYDAEGRVISASDSTSKLPLPEKMAGVKTGEFEIPSKFHKQKAREFVHMLSVDVKGAQLKEK
ncbi:hypothetical protein [Paraburkholderia hospita]|uniref:hypothetical protein n=1 Tax=Paraburkholderia hospita TaxID=169430 RepID=UPI003ECE3697